MNHSQSIRNMIFTWDIIGFVLICIFINFIDLWLDISIVELSGLGPIQVLCVPFTSRSISRFDRPWTFFSRVYTCRIWVSCTLGSSQVCSGWIAYDLSSIIVKYRVHSLLNVNSTSVKLLIMSFCITLLTSLSTNYHLSNSFKIELLYINYYRGKINFNFVMEFVNESYY